ncbi:hypothetical protein [Synechococcus sp. HK01-R]|uniref:hypothetical protein n=1 Tax=Synechococcus sp. HK01-R TaxID=2751171 RepID=UPI0016295964|nr:hypothetical protein [Synechococcus sp. HK01-R]QNG26983.1 hypothetical protein H0O21_12530 [Synechococcus sp. HK01-R]
MTPPAELLSDAGQEVGGERDAHGGHSSGLPECSPVASGRVTTELLGRALARLNAGANSWMSVPWAALKQDATAVVEIGKLDVAVAALGMGCILLHLQRCMLLADRVLGQTENEAEVFALTLYPACLRIKWSQGDSNS